MFNLIIVILLIVAVIALVNIALANANDGDYCVNDDLENGTTYLEYCLFDNKIISCSQNMTECLEAKKELIEK